MQSTHFSFMSTLPAPSRCSLVSELTVSKTSHHAKPDEVNWTERGLVKSIERSLMLAVDFDLTLNQS